MNISKIALHRPVAVLMCVACLVIFGISSVMSMDIESTPEMNMPVFMVMTRYSDVGPEEIDSLVTDVVEAALSGVSDYTSMTSRSSEGSSMTVLEFDYDIDMDEKRTEIEDAINNLRLPDDCDDPMIMEMGMDSDSIMSLSVLSTGDDNLLTYIEDEIVPQIERISGVSSVDVMGGKRDYIRIQVKEEEMTQFGLSLSQIASAISSADFTTTTGTINRGEVELSLLGSASYDTMESLLTIPISLSTGDIIYLTDVADVEMVEERNSSISRQNGQENIRISVSKNQSANTISICNQVEEVIDELNSQNLGLTIEITNNSGETIMDNIVSVISSLLQGMVISMIVLFFFLGEPKSSLIVALAMPLSVFAALVMMSVYGMTINMMSLGGLVVGIGMMVDNSIVVMESCFKIRATGRSFIESAEEAARIVASSIIASTLTTIVVFLPIALMDGMSGQLFKDVGFTIVFSLSASLLSALTVVPLLFVKTRPVEKDSGLIARGVHALERMYVVGLDKALRYRVIVVLLAVLLLGGTGFMFSHIDMELMPSMDRGNIDLSVTTKTGLNLEATDAIMTEIESIIQTYDDVDEYSLRSQGGSASLSISLKDDRTVDTDAVVERIRQDTAHIENCSIDVSRRNEMSFGSSGVSFSLQGNNLSQVEEASEQLKEYMRTYPEIISVSTSLSDGEPRAEIVVDPVQAAGYGTTPSAVVSQVRDMISGIEATTLQEGDSEYSVKVQYPDDRFYDVSDLSGMLITIGDSQVPLTDMAQVVYGNAPSTINRTDGKYSVSITGEVATGVSATQLTNTIRNGILSDLTFADGVDLVEGETMQMMQDEFSSIGIALLTAIWLVFVVMAVQFESMKFSIVVMISVPFALTGAFAALLITGQSISMTSLIGLVMLVGIVVNNAIVLIDYTNLLRAEQGLEITAALKAAGQSRLRPILMSTLTTILSLVPMAIGIGGEVEMMQGMAAVVIGGLSVSTFLTLFLVPIFYRFSERVSEKRAERIKKRRMKKGDYGD
ncbi:MAG: AcrB/AcrD/AcrF family protein [Oscillospiraceae bacterium]|nr:MAG: AcrB/AcrD/AcrF family protein [Oscillospiraceae bacterium]